MDPGMHDVRIEFYSNEEDNTSMIWYYRGPDTAGKWKNVPPEVKKEFVDAAILCQKAGFDCLELHCGHGYLLSQFLTPVINRRNDRYGGNAEKRAQLPLEIVLDIRAACGEDFPIV